MSIQHLSERNPSSYRLPDAIGTLLTGILTLVAVMGIGRFSLTPQIPVMIKEGSLTLSSAGILAAMNYIGYLLGALHASRLTKHHAVYLKTGLVATVLVTLLSAATADFTLQCLFRFLSGVGGAWALIIVTSWTQLTLASHQAPRLSAAVFTGPGVGIALTGLLAWGAAACGLRASQAWLVYGLVAAAAALLIFNRLPASLPSADRSAKAEPFNRNLKRLLAAYSLAGFGYILPATFLSQMAHSFFTSGNQAALFWPLFGLSAVAGVLLVIAFAARLNIQAALATAMVAQGVGVASVVIFPDVKGLFIATLLTGLGFLSIMQLSMRLARELSQGAMARTVAVLTSGYASGQLIGPLVSSASVTLFHSLHPALLLAAAGLALGGLIVGIAIKR